MVMVTNLVGFKRGLDKFMKDRSMSGFQSRSLNGTSMVRSSNHLNTSIRGNNKEGPWPLCPLCRTYYHILIYIFYLKFTYLVSRLSVDHNIVSTSIAIKTDSNHKISWLNGFLCTCTWGPNVMEVGHDTLRRPDGKVVTHPSANCLVEQLYFCTCHGGEGGV